MTDSNKTLLVGVNDHSGSMQKIREDAQGGWNSLVEKQAKEPGELFVTLIEFDDTYSQLFNMVPAADVKPYILEPAGTTALLDAMGKSITSIGHYLSLMPEDERPGYVIFAINTDGLENASKEWTLDAVNQLVTQQQQDYGWVFIFLGAGIDAVKVGGAMGVPVDHAMSYDRSQSVGTYSVASDVVSSTRGGVVRGFSQEEREELSQPK